MESDEPDGSGTSNYASIVEDAPDNWGRWGSNDELGVLNELDAGAVLQGVGAVKRGEVVPLGMPIAAPGGEPVWPTRTPTDHHMTVDKGDHDAGKLDRSAYGGWESADDLLYMYTHGTTHVDALGHAWYDDRLFNGFDAGTTTGGLERCGIDRVAEHGIVGRGILLDVARHRGVERLQAGDRITLGDVRECAREQGTDLRENDVVLLRTGSIELFLREGPDAYYAAYEGRDEGGAILDEPGLTYTEELCAWLERLSVPLLASDTVTAEQTRSSTTGTRLPLHPVLLRDLGVLIGELHRLDRLAAACADDGRYEFLYVASPLNIVGGTGSPVNPLAIR